LLQKEVNRQHVLAVVCQSGREKMLQAKEKAQGVVSASPRQKHKKKKKKKKKKPEAF